MQAGPSYVEAFVVVLRNVTKEDVVQYVLASLDDLISGNPSSAPQQSVCLLSINKSNRYSAHIQHSATPSGCRSRPSKDINPGQ